MLYNRLPYPIAIPDIPDRPQSERDIEEAFHARRGRAVKLMSEAIAACHKAGFDPKDIFDLVTKPTQESQK